MHEEARQYTNAVMRNFLEEFSVAEPDLVEAMLAFRQAATQFYVGQEGVFAKYGLTTGRFNLLLLLRSRENYSLSPSELAELVGVARGTVTQFVDVLERDGLVRRRDDPNDRRSMQIELTSKGESILKKVMPDFMKYISVTLKVLSRNEQKSMLKLFKKINRAQAKTV